jgi:hypothetical protein
MNLSWMSGRILVTGRRTASLSTRNIMKVDRHVSAEVQDGSKEEVPKIPELVRASLSDRTDTILSRLKAFPLACLPLRLEFLRQKIELFKRERGETAEYVRFAKERLHTFLCSHRDIQVFWLVISLVIAREGVIVRAGLIIVDESAIGGLTSEPSEKEF